jgi:hypothetical protein
VPTKNFFRRRINYRLRDEDFSAAHICRSVSCQWFRAIQL